MTSPRETPPLPEPAGREVGAAKALARLLDAAVQVPGTRIRVGLDPILGLVPGLGDVAGAGLAGYTVLLAARLGAPRSVVIRMLGNVAVDTLVGTLPFLGDLFDVGWKANLRNVALLERYLERPASTRAASRTVVALVLGGLALLGVAGAVLAVGVVRALIEMLG